jgi:uncharacterized protein YkwD
MLEAPARKREACISPSENAGYDRVVGVRRAKSGGVVGVVIVGLAGLGGCAPGDAVFGGSASGSGATDGSGDVPADGYCAPASQWDAELAAIEDEVVALVNEVRARGGSCSGQAFGPTPPLRHDGALRCAARVHSKDMNDRGFFDHDNPDGLDPFDRMELAGYRFSAAGENIAYNYPTAEAVVTGWLDSAGHCRNIRSEDFVDIGVGYYVEGGGPHLWTQVFGAPG